VHMEVPEPCKSILQVGVVLAQCAVLAVRIHIYCACMR